MFGPVIQMAEISSHKRVVSRPNRDRPTKRGWRNWRDAADLKSVTIETIRVRISCLAHAPLPQQQREWPQKPYSLGANPRWGTNTGRLIPPCFFYYLGGGSNKL